MAIFLFGDSCPYRDTVSRPAFHNSQGAALANAAGFTLYEFLDLVDAHYLCGFVNPQRKRNKDFESRLRKTWKETWQITLSKVLYAEVILLVGRRMQRVIHGVEVGSFNKLYCIENQLYGCIANPVASEYWKQPANVLMTGLFLQKVLKDYASFDKTKRRRNFDRR